MSALLDIVDEIGVVTSLVEAASMAAEGVTSRKESGALLVDKI